MVKIVESYATNNKNHFAGTNPCNWITVHETDNWSRGANAMAHAANMRNNLPAETFHYAVDSAQAVHIMPDTIRCWHAGDGSGNGNMSSIGIEICVNSDGNYPQAVKNCAELVAKLMKQHGVTIDHVVQHNHWSGKNCPSGIRSGKQGQTWAKFISMVKAAYGETTPKPSTGVSNSKPANNVKVGDKVKIVDALYVDSYGKGRSTAKRGSTGTIKRTDGKGSKKYLVENWGWAHPNDIQLVTSAKPSTPTKKSNDTIANEVIAHKWGDDPARSQKLKAAGYDAKTIQDLVNKKLGAKPAAKKTNKKSNAQIAKEIYYGQGGWGNEPQRSQKLRKAGYDPAAVQREVNKLF